MEPENVLPTHKKRPKVVIIGAGFGGLMAAKKLRNCDVDIEIIDRRNYHLFQPLLYQVATADLSPADIAWPIRGLFSSQKNVSVSLSEVEGIDLENRKIRCSDHEADFDYLIVATGSHHSYFGSDEWSRHAPGLKRVGDATQVRRRILLAFERAEVARSAEEQRKQLNFVVVGGGPTGVEMAGAIADLAHVALAKDFRRVSPADARVILVESSDRLLNAFPESLSQKAENALEKLGVEVWTNAMVTDITADGVATTRGDLPAATVVWGAGVQVRNLGDWLNCETDRTGRIPVHPDLSVPGSPHIFVIGDAAQIPWRENEYVPGIAPAAKQAGRYVAKVIAHKVRDEAPIAPFKYRHAGNLATIGRHAAVIDFGKYKMSGALAWWVWGIAHIYFLIGVRRPLFVALSWFWSYLTFSKGARLITGQRKSRDG